MRKETMTIKVCHNIEVAHRLSQTPGKCMNIHGHSMWVELEMWGDIDDKGLLEGLDYGFVKSRFRGHLDSRFDHHLLLNQIDPLVGLELPGLELCTEDPTTENIAKWIGYWGVENLAYLKEGPLLKRMKCTVHETKVNIATWEWEV